MPANTHLTTRSGALGGTSMRYHELALVHWINQWAIVREGYPIPVVISNPTDAFAHFAQLWADTNNPFAYLLEAKDENGTPLYQPHPAPVRYPVISVHRTGWKYRPGQNFSLHRWRHLNWPTVSDVEPVPGKPQIGTELRKPDLGEVMTARRPMAWDYNFKIDHYCNRPDTQAFFIQQFMEQMWRTGGVPQTWIPVVYPGYGEMLVRLYFEGNIDSPTPEEPPEGQSVEFRTSVSLILEGYMVDLRYKVYPALWYLVVGQGEVNPDALELAWREDVRRENANPTLDAKHDIPPDKPVSEWQIEDESKRVSVDAVAGWTVKLAVDAKAAWDVEG